MEAESVHEMTLIACAMAARSSLLTRVIHSRLRVVDPCLKQTIAGIPFENPLGLAAGFDKNGVAIEMLGALGFGHVEIGSISAHPSTGNLRPRLFRIPQDLAIVVHYGVPNLGADIVAEKLAGRKCRVPVGINLVKTNDPKRPADDEAVLSDYAMAFEKLRSLGSYVTLNLSCPNSAADRNYFDDVSKIHALLERLAERRPEVPVFLKLKPTVDRSFLQEVVAAAAPFGFVAGFAINLPAGKPSELNFTMPRAELERLPGAVSGRPVEDLINANLRMLFETIGPVSRFKLVAAGGVFSAEDAYRKVRLGASLVQLYTSMVYAGPGVVKAILLGLLALLRRDGFDNIADAVGADVVHGGNAIGQTSAR
jgi:dihydroorotate dehydrogenase